MQMFRAVVIMGGDFEPQNVVILPYRQYYVKPFFTYFKVKIRTS
jgi:hypothetical protein